MNSLYIIGSLRNPRIPEIAKALRTGGFDVFDDWFAAGPEADDYWQRYETQRGRDYREALQGRAANNVFQFDKGNLERCDGALLVLPAGKSGHLELGYMAGLGKWTGVLFEDEPERWDVMYQFVNQVFLNQGELEDFMEMVRDAQGMVQAPLEIELSK